MARLGTFFSKQTLTAGLPYFEYQLEAAREAVIPWLDRRIALDGIAVGDFGAHQGGLIEALRRDGRVARATGIELNAAVVEQSPFVGDERFQLVAGDLTALDPGFGPFDLIVLHDVLEHVVRVDEVLHASADRLAPAGRLLVVFPPYGSAFGGHQQLAEGWARAAPFLHLLPAPLFFRLARPGAGNEYMTVEDALGDLRAVRLTRLTLTKAERAFARAGLATADRELFLVRPEHSLRYGIRTRAAGPLGRVPGVRELAVSGAYYLLKRV
jgi:SAM-dependent methyltransferase